MECGWVACPIGSFSAVSYLPCTRDSLLRSPQMLEARKGPGVSQGVGENVFRREEKRYQLHQDVLMKKR